MTSPATPDTATLERLADQLWQAQQTGESCAPLTQEFPDLTVDDAYTIQTFNIERRTSERGLLGPPSHRVGHKIGITSEAVQEWLGVNEPDFGVLLDDMIVGDGQLARTDLLLQPQAEGEIAFIMDRDLAGPGVTAVDVISSVAYVLPAVEIVDSRIANWEVKLADTIADNASSGMLALGTRPTRLTDVDLVLAGMTFLKNGRVTATGAGAACLGNPINAIVWLANKLGELGQTIHAGEMLISGALGPVTPVAAGDHVEVRIAHLGSACVRF